MQDLQDEEHDLLVSLARTDPDPRVRRAAVSRLGNVAVLTDVVRRETDAQVRDEAAGVLLDIALGAYEADEAASLAAVEGSRRCRRWTRRSSSCSSPRRRAATR